MGLTVTSQAIFFQVKLTATSSTTLLLPQQPLLGSLQLYCNGIFLCLNVDYTLDYLVVTVLNRTIAASDVYVGCFLSI